MITQKKTDVVFEIAIALIVGIAIGYAIRGL